MTKLIELRGDLFSSDARAFGQGVNITGVMGAGIAAQFRARHWEMFREYADACRDRDLLPGHVFTWVENDTVIFNLATQDQPGPNARIEWIHDAVHRALREADAEEIEKIAIPRLGCGIGGLNWADVKPVLEQAAAGYDCDFEVWSLTA